MTDLTTMLIESREAVMINRMAYDKAMTRYDVLLARAAVEIEDLSQLPKVVALAVAARQTTNKEKEA